MFDVTTDYLLFTYHIVNIKRVVVKPKNSFYYLFTYHIVNIKLERNEVISGSVPNLHIT